MPRASTKKRTGTAVQVVKEEVWKKQNHPDSIFPLVVHEAIEAKLVVDPNDSRYDADKDRLRVGFQFGNRVVPSWMPHGTKLEDVSAYDFLTSPKTGLRPGSKTKPHGCSYTTLEYGIHDHSDLCPIFIWKMGMWLGDIITMHVLDLAEPEFDVKNLPGWMRSKVERGIEAWPSKGTPPDIFPFYITPGEGTTGNSVYRVYEVPEDMARRSDPHHPQMWPEKYKKTKEKKYGWTGYPLASQTPKPAVQSTPTPASFSPPAGTRMRCPDCGHWYSYQDLIQHSVICGDPEKVDWAIMCHSDCGCVSLDQASTPKPGFPRPKVKKEEEPHAGLVTPEEEKEVTDANKDGADGVSEEVPL